MKPFRILIIPVILFLCFPPLVRSQKLGKNVQTSTWKQTLLDVGNWRYYMTAGEKGIYAPASGALGYYPIDGTNVIYKDGLLWAGWLKDPNTGNRIEYLPLRAGGIFFRTSIQPGWINEDGRAAQFEDSETWLYRFTNKNKVVGTDFFKYDASYLLQIPVDQITDEDVAKISDIEGKDAMNWPVQLGAPFIDVNGDGYYAFGIDQPGFARSDQIIWGVFNDLDTATVEFATGSCPIGLEINITAWTYAGQFSPGSQVIFKRYQLINKSDYLLDSLFIGIWLDADIGNYSDDLVGCDSTRDFFYAYNGNWTDEKSSALGLAPPAVGLKVLQGPIVYTGNLQDTALFHQQWKTGYKNLGLYAFNSMAIPFIEINPPGGSYLTTLSIYNILRGYKPGYDIHHPEPFIVGYGSNKGRVTRFPLHGNPLTGSGDLDGKGDNPKPGDRRIAGSFGPLTMPPGEEQEIIFAIIGGQGSNRLLSLAEVEKLLPFIELFYKAAFKDIPRAPETPEAKATPLGEKIVLNWGIDEKRVEQIEKEAHAGYHFEGYNVYQLRLEYSQEGSNIGTVKKIEKKKIATFDVINGVTRIESRYYDPHVEGSVFGTVQKGRDSGIKRHLVVDWDYINDCPLYRGTTYYYQITAYNYNPDIAEYSTFESEGKLLQVVLQNTKPGSRYLAAVEDTIPYQKIGSSDVRCTVTVVDPTELTGHDYEIRFQFDRDTTSATYGELLWDLWDLTLNAEILSKQKVFTQEEFEHNDGVSADGLQIKIGVPPENRFKQIYQYADSYGPIERETQFIGTDDLYENVWHSLTSPRDPYRFYLSSGLGEEWLTLNLLPIFRNHDFEMRFTEDGSLFYWYYDSIQATGHVPFEFWDVGPGTYQDSTDDVRLIALGYSDGHTPGIFDYGQPDPTFGFPATDWIYVRYPLNADGSYEAFVQDVLSSAPTLKWFENSAPVFDALTICDFGPSGQLPLTNVVFRFITPKYPDENFKITFTAPGKIENDLELMKKDVEKINVFPNPYYAASPLEPDRFTHFVTFNHLPPHAVIRIFTLGGALVRKLEKNDPSQFYRWDLLNEKGWRVASGLYIVHIDMPELKKQKILKLMVITGEEVLDTM